jgi:hypothetical protein
MKSTAITLLLAAAAITLPNQAGAGTVSLTDFGATATLNSATIGDTGSHTLDAGDLHTAFTGTWTLSATATSDGTAGWLTVDGTPNNWNSPVTGTWGINPTFWTTFSSAVISIQVSNEGDENKKWFAWVITPTSTTGNWTYTKNGGEGGGDGGDSNGGVDKMQLWGSGEGSSNAPGVPDAGSTLALMGIALAGLGLISRKSSRR